MKKKKRIMNNKVLKKFILVNNEHSHLLEQYKKLKN